MSVRNGNNGDPVTPHKTACEYNYPLPFAQRPVGVYILLLTMGYLDVWFVYPIPHCSRQRFYYRIYAALPGNIGPTI